jgi:putative restriction endonuclease
MAGADFDWQARLAAFDFVDRLTQQHGDPLPWAPLRDGFEFGGRRITLLGVRGIWKPQTLDLPISIRTSPKNPYGDEASEDGYLHYRYYKDNPNHPDNAGLRECFERGLPLIYFAGVEEGWYSPVLPLVLVNDDPGSLTVVGACEDVQALRLGVSPDVADDVRRRYATRLAVVRLHQAGFRQRVLSAYRKSCTVCSLKHPELLDAAHIIGDKEETGELAVSNGLAMCKIHHAAFDRNILGIRPDHVVEIRGDILRETDGPMLKHGLQELHWSELAVLPARATDQPDAQRLEQRYDEFRAAS